MPTNELDFLNIASVALERRFQDLKSKILSAYCPDQYVGLIKDINNNRRILKTDRKAIDEIDKESRPSCLIMILESPHTSEFRNERGPAMGTTGNKIALHINRENDELKRCSDNGFGLILVNAIRYQCSIGISTECARDAVFEQVWSTGGREDFMDRLGRTYRDDDVVVNCCTKGKIKLREKVQKAIEGIESLKGAQIVKSTHPSSWPKHRNATWQ